MNVSGVVASVLGLVLGALLLVLIGQSLRTAFSRPGASASAMAAYSLSIGRGMLLVVVIGGSLLSTRLTNLTGSSATWISVIGVIALLLLIGAETRWPRQSGAVRVAMLGRPTLRRSVEARYLIGLGVSAVFVAGSAVFFLLVDPAVPSAPRTSALLVGLGSLVVMAAVAVVALGQVLGRRTLAGVGAEVDEHFRRISAQRIIRALVTAMLAVVAAMAQDLQQALDPGSFAVAGLPKALASFVFLVQIGCLLGALVLYQVGPSEKSTRKAGLPVASARR